MTFQLAPLDPRTAPEPVLRGVHAVITAIEIEEVPQGPATTYEQQVLRLTATPPPHLAVSRRIALDGDSVVGYSMCQTWPQQDPDNSFVQIMVHPDHRRNGIGTALLTDVVEQLISDGRGKIIIDCVDGWPIQVKLEGLGLRNSLSTKRSRLETADIDVELMDSWISRAQERADDYEMFFVDAPIPVEILDEWARVKSAINDEPFEDLEFEFTAMTPERWRSHERFAAERGEKLLACAARHIPSGSIAGTTIVYLQKHMEDYAIQGDTAVEASHRNRGLGRLVKAAMAKRIVTEYPAVRMIDTQNAGSNDAMLGINIEMGFRPFVTINAWQGETKAVLENLSE